MVKRIIPAVLLTSMIAGTALAATLSASGVIKSIDTAKNDIVLNTGETFMLPAKFDMRSIKVGEKVSINYQKRGGQMVATTVAAAK